MKLGYMSIAGGVLLSAALSSPAAAADCATGQVTAARDGEVEICVGAKKTPQVGEVINLSRLQPVTGPSRPPHFLWQKVAKVRVVSADGPTVLARVERGTPRVADKADLDHGW